MYTTLFPNDECCKLIVQAGIKTVIYGDDKYHNEDAWVSARRILSAGRVQAIYFGDLVNASSLSSTRTKASIAKEIKEKAQRTKDENEKMNNMKLKSQSDLLFLTLAETLRLTAIGITACFALTYFGISALKS